MDKEIEILLSLLSSFKKGEIVSKSILLSLNKKEIHYYYEIIRYWNQLNFIISKTLRSFDQEHNIPNIKSSYLFYATFRIIKERASPDQVLIEGASVGNKIGQGLFGLLMMFHGFLNSNLVKFL